MTKRLQRLKNTLDRDVQLRKDISSVLSNIQLPDTVFDHLYKTEMKLLNKIFHGEIQLQTLEQRRNTNE